jgi:hypothetical protein
VTIILRSREAAMRPSVKSIAEASACRTEGKSLVVLLGNWRSVCNKTIEVWNLVAMHNPDAVISTELWLKEDISNVKSFEADKIFEGIKSYVPQKI